MAPELKSVRNSDIREWGENTGKCAVLKPRKMSRVKGKGVRKIYVVFFGGGVGIKFILPSAGFPSRSLKCKSGKTGDVSRPEEEDSTRLGDRIDAKIFLRSFRHRSALSLSLFFSPSLDGGRRLDGAAKKFFFLWAVISFRRRPAETSWS